MPASAPRGEYFVVACADGTWRVRERDERNNCRASAGRVTLLEPFQPSPVHLTEGLDTARAVTADIGPGGGSLAATAADGTRLTLDVPAGALTDSVAIRMTPLAQATGLPGGASLVAAARFDPAGLVFRRPATLTIEPATPVPVASQLPFATDDGRDAHAYPLLGRRAVVLPVLHFSTYGLARGTTWTPQPSSRVAWAEQNLAAMTRRARVDAVTGRFNRSDEEIGQMVLSAAYIASFVTANEWVGPLLRQAVADRSLRRLAIAAYLKWVREADVYGVIHESKLDAFADEFRDLFVKILRLAVEDAVRDCEEGRTGFDAAMEVLSAVRQTELTGVLHADEAAGFISRLWECLRFELTVTSTSSWTSDFSHASSQLQGTALLGEIPLAVVSWNAEIVGDVADVGCVATDATYVVERPFAAVSFNYKPVDANLEHFSLDVWLVQVA